SEGYEPERRGWDEKTYRLKNHDTNNHYDFSRKHLNFEIDSEGKMVPLGSNPIPLHERLKHRLDELGFKPYKGKDNPLCNADNSPNCTVGIIVSGDHDVLTRLAFGEQDVDFTLQRSNSNVQLQQGIKDWAMDTYQWASERWGAENIIGFDVHCDETTPHIHIQTVPVAKTKVRGRATVKYVHKDDKSRMLSHKEWKKLPEEIRNDFIRTEVERREKECVSYARVWGTDKYEVGRTYYQMHTDYHNKVGYKYGLERGDDFATLTEEEQRGRVHKDKKVLEAERQARESIKQSKVEKEEIEQQKDRIAGEVQEAEQRKVKAKRELANLEAYINATDITREDLLVPSLNTNPLVMDACNAIIDELNKPIPFNGQKAWREERKTAIKRILSDLQDNLFNAQEMQKKDILNLGQSLYYKAMKDARAIIKQNKQLQKANELVTAENTRLKEKISTMDETAINKLRKEKDEEIAELKAERNKALSNEIHSNNMVSRERQRAEHAESQLKEMLSIPEIKEIWDGIQQNRKAFWLQIDRWIGEATAAIRHFAKDYGHNDFMPEQGEDVAMGIIAKAFKCNLDASDKEQRMKATQHLLDEVSWAGTTDFMSELAKTR
ncbi:MAG: plasmid recombination protein, partial [Bacteroidaceae bacterium]|nr:plasmid recombination protein [Bacteroidaceae bacterium]